MLGTVRDNLDQLDPMVSVNYFRLDAKRTLRVGWVVKYLPTEDLDSRQIGCIEFTGKGDAMFTISNVFLLTLSEKIAVWKSFDKVSR